MKDVAAQAGVSLKTVSRVINDEHGVRPELEARVRATAHQLGYQPDHRARELRRGDRSSRSIGFIQADVGNPFFSRILRGVEDVARAHGYLFLSGSTDGEAEREEALLNTFIARRIDGLIMVPSTDNLGVLLEEQARGTPVVFLDLEPKVGQADIVRSDHHGGARAATAHMIARGQQRIAFIGDDESIFSAAERLRGFRDEMTAAGLPTPWIRTGIHHPDHARRVATELLQQADGPSALFTAQNFVTMGAVRALHDLGLAEHRALVGFDDIDLADVVRPGISVVPQDAQALGQRSAELVFRRLAGTTGPAISQVLPMTVVARGSGEIRPPRP
jgi:LacI family transcriptional regulator